MRQPLEEETLSFSIKRFVVTLFLLMAVSFSLWWSISADLVSPVISLADSLLDVLLPHSFHELKQQGADGLVFSTWGEVGGQLVPARQAGHYLAFQFNTQILSFSLPFFCALTLAMPGAFQFGKLLFGIAVLYIILLLGVVVLSIKTLMIGIGPVAFKEGVDTWFLNINVIGLLYQFNTLILPVLAPVLLWAAQQKKILAVFINKS